MLSKADTAIHEAGHVACALAEGLSIVSAVLDVGGATGHMLYHSDTSTIAGCASLIVAVIGGPLAVSRKLGTPLDYTDSRWRGDRASIERTLNKLHALRGTTPQTAPFDSALFRVQVAKAEAHLAENWRLVEHIAIELLIKGTVPGERLEDICISADEPVKTRLHANAFGLWPVLQAC